MTTIHTLWEKILKLAIIGTDRTNLDQDLNAHFKSLNIDENTSPPTKIMEAATQLAIMKKAGYPLEKWKGPVYSKSTSSEPYISKKIIEYLGRIIDGSFRGALPEFIELVKDKGGVIPPKFLPDLLDMAIEFPDFWKTIKPIIGDRGQWLIKIHPEWNKLAPQLTLQDWQEGNLDHLERLIVIRSLCAIHPERTAELLLSEWPSLSKQEKKVYLEIIFDNPQQANESLLSLCQTDADKDIRVAATTLLAKVPGSQFLKNLFQAIEDLDLIQYQQRTLKKPKIAIEEIDSLPEKLLEYQVRLEPQKSNIRIIIIILTLVPPSFWENKFGHPPKETLELFVRSEWGELLLPAFITATSLHRNEGWAYVLVDFWLDNFYKQRWEQFNPKDIIKYLSLNDFNELAFKAISQIGNFSDEKSPAVILLRENKNAWFDNVAIAFFDNFLSWTNNNGGRFWSGWLYKGLIKDAAFLVNTNLFDKLHQRFSYYPDGFESELNQFFNVLQFRKSMKEAIQEEG